MANQEELIYVIKNEMDGLWWQPMNFTWERLTISKSLKETLLSTLVFHRNVGVTLLSSSVSNSLCDVNSLTYCWQRLKFQEQKFASNCCHCQEGRWGISSQDPNSQWNMSLSLWLKNKVSTYRILSQNFTCQKKKVSWQIRLCQEDSYLQVLGCR